MSSYIIEIRSKNNRMWLYVKNTANHVLPFCLFIVNLCNDINTMWTSVIPSYILHFFFRYIAVPTVTDETWKSLVLDADCPVLVEFWAPWCGPCRMLHPVVGELSRQYVGRLKCLNLNTDDNPSIASKYGIRNIPTVMIFVNGEKKDAIIGAVPKTTLTASINKFL